MSIKSQQLIIVLMTAILPKLDKNCYISWPWVMMRLAYLAPFYY